MDFIKEFNRMMEEQNEIALATAINGKPNVRIVNFYYEKSEKGILYFSSFDGNRKIEEFAKNKEVAFTTISHKNEEHVRVKEAIVEKSKISVYEIKDKFLKKLPDYIMSIPEVLEHLVLFEVHFKTAEVVIDFQNMDTITL